VRRAGALLAGLALAMAGAGAAPRPAEHTIVMAHMGYGAVPAGIKVGDTIVWTNRDIVPHTVTARDRSFDIVVQPRQSARMTVRHAGRIAFYCRFHPSMTGTLAVAAR
jgi:plastocyanin